MKTLRFLSITAVLAVFLFLARTASADHWRGGWHRGPVVSVGIGYGGYRYGGYRCGYGYGSYGYPYYAPYYGAYYEPAYAYYEPPVRRVYVGRQVYSEDRDYPVHSLAADVQKALAKRRYYHGAIDGDIGPASREAIREYQSEHRLPVTGRIDERLVRSLGL